jgi:transcriptional regulator with XRE-family HTH domain
MPLGKTIEALRVARGWSNAELARRANVTQGTMQRIESSGSVKTTVQNMQKIARALDVTIDTLLSETTVDAIVDRLNEFDQRISALEARIKPKR